MTLPDLHRLLADCLERCDQKDARITELEAALKAALARVASDERTVLTNREAAAFIGRAAGFLNKNRLEGGAAMIPFYREGVKSIRYQRADLVAFLESKKVRRSVASP